MAAWGKTTTFFFFLNPKLYLEEPASILSLSETLNLSLI